VHTLDLHLRCKLYLKLLLSPSGVFDLSLVVILNGSVSLSRLAWLPRLPPPTCARPVSGVGLGPRCYTASLLWSPGPRPPPVFRSAICDCLSLNVSVSYLVWLGCLVPGLVSGVGLGLFAMRLPCCGLLAPAFPLHCVFALRSATVYQLLPFLLTRHRYAATHSQQWRPAPAGSSTHRNVRPTASSIPLTRSLQDTTQAASISGRSDCFRINAMHCSRLLLCEVLRGLKRPVTSTLALLLSLR